MRDGCGMNGPTPEAQRFEPPEGASPESQLHPDRIRFALDVGGTGIWSWHGGTQQFFGDRGAALLWGLPNGQTMSTQVFLASLVPDDSDRTLEELRRSAGPNGPEHCALEFRIRRSTDREVKDRAIKTIMSSDDVMGGSTTFTMMSTTSRFQHDNPKVFGAVVKALKSAQEMIGEDKRNAATVLLDAMGGGKGWTLDELVGILDEPGTKYTMKPENVLTYADFMHEIGSLKNKPGSLKDLFFDNPDVVGGN